MLEADPINVQDPNAREMIRSLAKRVEDLECLVGIPPLDANGLEVDCSEFKTE